MISEQALQEVLKLLNREDLEAYAAANAILLANLVIAETIKTGQLCVLQFDVAKQSSQVAQGLVVSEVVARQVSRMSVEQN